ncbi:uncharacterized protein LOC127641859 [Xyrauchen texanus]|uniref:uncharacterized protein LOC127641859 n=1 Tax=Xyrauchen texanus TaxID=154827 RepID=UPI002241E613|nr:uncharacterized protein LOC127641859 [Xyrauchen texanus]
MLQQERGTAQSSNDQYAKELSQLKQQMRQLQIQMEHQRPESQPLSPATPTRQYSSSRPIPAPRFQPQARYDKPRFRPVPAPRFKPQKEYQTEDKLQSPPHHPTPASTSNIKQSSSYHFRPQGVKRSEAHYSHRQEYLNPPYWVSQDTAKHPQMPCRSLTPSPPPEIELMYRGPTPTIPDFIHPNPREFSRLKIALENILPANATERFKFQILMDHLKLEEALLIADSYCHSQHPYTRTMAALDQQFGQPHQLALQRIAELMDGTNIASGDQKAFRLFALKVRSLVGMLEQLGKTGHFELHCGSHVSRLLGKLRMTSDQVFGEWLEFEIQVQEDTTRFASNQHKGPLTRTRETIRDSKPAAKRTTIFLSTEKAISESTLSASPSKTSLKPYCTYCDNSKHSLNNCTNFKLLTKDQKRSWVKDNNRCWRCGRTHKSAECNLKMRCRQCNSRHLMALHDISAGKPDNPKPVHDDTADTNTCLLNTMNEILLIHKPPTSRKVLLKIIKVILRNGKRKMDAYAIQDDGSERTILLHNAAQQLGLKGQPEDLPLEQSGRSFKFSEVQQSHLQSPQWLSPLNSIASKVPSLLNS